MKEEFPTAIDFFGTAFLYGAWGTHYFLYLQFSMLAYPYVFLISHPDNRIAGRC